MKPVGRTMIVVYRILVAIAALLVIVIGGTWLGDKYGLGPDLGWWGPPKVTEKTLAAVEGVPATASGSVSISGQRGLTSILASSTPIVPVFFGRAGYGFSYSFLRGNSEQIMEGGSCAERIVNLLATEVRGLSGAPVFDHRVLVSHYFYFTSDIDHSVVALVVDKDTNHNGLLDCDDEARLEKISLKDNQVKVLDRVFIPEEISNIEYDPKEETFTLSETKESGEKVALKTVVISRMDFSASETLEPDLLSKAKAAFNKTAR